MSDIKTTKTGNNLGTDNIRSLVLKLAIPAMLAQFVNVLYSVVDRIYIGNIPEVGEIALAGVGICGPIVTMISAFAAWVGIGGAPLMSIKMGAGNHKEARRILANSLLLLLGMSVLLTLFAYLFKDILLMKFGATETIFPFANDYMKIYLIGTVFSMLALGLNQFIISQGFSGLGMCSVVIGAVFNIALDPVFIFGLHMGVSGAALATVISQAASCLFTLYVLSCGKTPIGISFGGYDFSLCTKILTVGISPFIIILFDNILIILQNVMIKSYGGLSADALLTCNTIVQSFMLMITMPLGGITGGTQSILGFNYGAGNGRRIKDAEKQILKTGLIFCTIMFLLAQFASKYFVYLFTKDATYVEMSVHFIRIYTLGVIPLAVQYALVDGFTGMSIAQAALPLSTFRKTIYIALVCIFAMTLGAEFIFWAEPISDVCSAIVTSVTFLILLPKILAHAGADKK